MSPFTAEEGRAAGELLAAGVGVTAVPFSRKWWKRRADRKAQHAFEDGLPEVPGVREAIPKGRERTVMLERDMKFVRQSLAELSVTVESLAQNQGDMKAMITNLDKKITGNGGNTYDSGDVLQRVAKALGVWEVGSEHEKNRREGDTR